jgi:hypothetical protein
MSTIVDAMTAWSPGGSGSPQRDFARSTSVPRSPSGPGMAMSAAQSSMFEMWAVEQWRAAEAKLYPLIMVDPDLFETAVTMVAEASQLLRTQCDTVEDLLEIDTKSLASRCPSVRRVMASGLSPMLAVDAARARRWLEINGMPQLASGGALLDGGR